MNITLQQMKTLDAVVEHGSLQAAARYLNKTHPSVITALKKMEDELGFSLLDRSGYRTTLSSKGSTFHKHARKVLNQMDELSQQASSLVRELEPELSIVIGDITPLSDTLKVFRAFHQQHTSTELSLYFENIHGPNERLLNGEVDFIVHNIDKADPRYEYKNFCTVPIVPVAAPGFFDFSQEDEYSYSSLKHYTQCVIRDTAEDKKQDYFLLPDTPRITVGDQYTKKEIIRQQIAWGHMPLFLVESEFASGELISIENDFIKGHVVDIVIARRQSGKHGIMANSLWDMF